MEPRDRNTLPPGFVFYSPNQRYRLLVPLMIWLELDAEAHRVKKKQCVEPATPKIPVADDEFEEHRPAAEAPPFVGEASLQIFDPEVIRSATHRIAKEERERSERLLPVLVRAGAWGGRRRLPKSNIALMNARLQALGKAMPNFQTAIDILVGELALAMTGPAEAFRVSPIALYGVPGIGKTRFAREVAAILDVGFESIALGGTDSGFELAGVSPGYSTTRAGRIAKLLAEGDTASPVVMLDEIDKARGDDRYPVVPTLLELLEADSAKAFRDQGLEIRMDASRIVYLATANDPELIPAPLQSRLRMLEVSAPTQEQRRGILGTIADEFIGVGVHFPGSLLDRLADEDLDLRVLRRVLRETAGIMLARGGCEVTEVDLVLPEHGKSWKLGFA
jgi:ATP-dependent Lon protease